MNQWALTVAAGALLLLIVANRRNDIAEAIEPATVDLPDDASGVGAEQGQGSSLDVLSMIDPTTYFPANTDDDTKQANRDAILLTIRNAEGTNGPDGYRQMFGYHRFFDNGFVDHPRQPEQFTTRSGARLWSSAAGAFQFMAISPIPGTTSRTRVDTWDRLKAKLHLSDFTPASQDAAALELIAECGALNDVDAGRFDQALAKMRSTWASLPGAGYGQPERTLASLRQVFTDAGGTLA